jgi:hypothetical protein
MGTVIEFGGLAARPVRIAWPMPIAWQTGVADSAASRRPPWEPIRGGGVDNLVAGKPCRPQPTDKAVRSWMRERVMTWPADRPAPTEAEDVAAVQAHFAPGLSRDEFRIVREGETPKAWRKQGPRRPWGIEKKSAT